MRTMSAVVFSSEERRASLTPTPSNAPARHTVDRPAHGSYSRLSECVEQRQDLFVFERTAAANMHQSSHPRARFETLTHTRSRRATEPSTTNVITVPAIFGALSSKGAIVLDSNGRGVGHSFTASWSTSSAAPTNVRNADIAWGVKYIYVLQAQDDRYQGNSKPSARVCSSQITPTVA